MNLSVNVRIEDDLLTGEWLIDDENGSLAYQDFRARRPLDPGIVDRLARLHTPPVVVHQFER